MKTPIAQLNNIFDKAIRADWELVKFGDVAHEVKETTRDPVAEGIERVVGLENLTPLDIHIRSWENIEDETTFTRKFRKGQVLFGKRRAYQRKAALAEFDGVCSGDILVLEANTDKIESELLPFLVHSDGFYRWAVSTSAGSLSPRTKFKHLAEYEFRLPPRPVQKKIAELLWATDDTREKYLVAIDQAYISLQSVFQEKHQDENAEEITLEQLAIINPGLSDDEAEINGSVDFVPMEAVSEDGELTLGQQKDFQPNKSSLTNFRNGDVIFAKITPCMENGKGAVIEGVKSKVALGSTEFHVLRPRLESDLYYIYYLTKLPFFRGLAERHMTGSAGQKRVPTDFLKDFKLKAPSPKSRENLGMVSHKIWQEKKRCEKQLETTTAMRGAILNSLS